MWLKRKIRVYIWKVYVQFYGVFHKTTQKVLFESFTGKQYSDNPRAISEKLHELYPQFEIVWHLDSECSYDIIPDYVRIVKGKKAFCKELATCSVFVSNEAMEPDKYKRKNQFFIQTWHGDRGYKKILYDAWDDGKRPIPIIDNLVTDLCVSGSAFGENVYRTAFKYKGEILNVGSPRNDCLLANDLKKINIIKNDLEINNKKVLLYAPTLRESCEDYHMGNLTVDLKKIYSILNTNEEWVILLRLHPMQKEYLNIKSGFEFMDVTDYPDMSDLLLIADVLITDYSSCSCDFVLTKKPIILATFDRKQYEKECRELLVHIDEPGFFVADNQKELNQMIKKLTIEDYIEAAEKVFEFYGISESGESSKVVCDRIFDFFQKRDK